MLDLPPAPPEEAIVITAARTPQPVQDSAANVTVLDEAKIERLGPPLAADLLRLVPSVSVAQSGGPGTVAEVRIRGAEANHTLLFIDGIRANDPARGEAPRFELVNADLASRIEVVRGPQSALWGSEAIGGVVAVNTQSATDRPEVMAGAEAGSRGFRRASANVGTPGVGATLAWQQADGVDIFGGGDRDGYRNLAGRVAAKARPADWLEVGANGFFLTGDSQFDGPDPYTFERSHPLDSRDRMVAGRVWAGFGRAQSDWSGRIALSRLHSSSRNFFESDEINRTSGGRTALSGQLAHRFVTGKVEHQIVIAGETERERFKAADIVYGGATAQRRHRTHDSMVAQWQSAIDRLKLDVAVRHDRFSRFRDATTVRASGLIDIGHGLKMAASYGEGIAQPTFFDLFGFFPGSFVGNPSLKAERSRGFELSLRRQGKRLNAAVTLHQQRLRDEIVETFDSGTFLASTVNVEGVSRRRGLEVEAAWSPAPWLRLQGHYAYLEATQPDAFGGRHREVRRPKHSGAISLDGTLGSITYGASLAYTGQRTDNNFEIPPFGRVRLEAYWLAGARIAYEVRPGIEVFGRVSNAFDERYEDVFAYRTEGRGVYAGIRLADRR